MDAINASEVKFIDDGVQVAPGAMPNADLSQGISAANVTFEPSTSNNLGNIRLNKNAFRSYATPEEGVADAVGLLRKAYRNRSIYKMGNKWLGFEGGGELSPEEKAKNDPVQWAANIAANSGLDPKQIPDLDNPEVLHKFLTGLAHAEKSEEDRLRFTPEVIRKGIEMGLAGQTPTWQPEKPIVEAAGQWPTYIGGYDKKKGAKLVEDLVGPESLYGKLTARPTPGAEPEVFSKDWFLGTLPRAINRAPEDLLRGIHQISKSFADPFYSRLANVDDPNFDPSAAAGGILADQAKALYHAITGMSEMSGKPIGVYGLDAAHESWRDDPAMSAIGILPLLKGITSAASLARARNQAANPVARQLYPFNEEPPADSAPGRAPSEWSSEIARAEADMAAAMAARQAASRERAVKSYERRKYSVTETESGVLDKRDESIRRAAKKGIELEKWVDDEGNYRLREKKPEVASPIEEPVVVPPIVEPEIRAGEPVVGGEEVPAAEQVAEPAKAAEVPGASTPFPDWLIEEMQRQGIKPGRLLNEYDMEHPGTRESLANDPVVKHIQTYDQKLYEEALRGNITAEEYLEAKKRYDDSSSFTIDYLKRLLGEGPSEKTSLPVTEVDKKAFAEGKKLAEQYRAEKAAKQKQAAVAEEVARLERVEEVAGNKKAEEPTKSVQPVNILDEARRKYEAGEELTLEELNALDEARPLIDKIRNASQMSANLMGLRELSKAEVIAKYTQEYGRPAAVKIANRAEALLKKAQKERQNQVSAKGELPTGEAVKSVQPVNTLPVKADEVVKDAIPKGISRPIYEALQAGEVIKKNAAKTGWVIKINGVETKVPEQTIGKMSRAGVIELDTERQVHVLKGTATPIGSGKLSLAEPPVPKDIPVDNTVYPSYQEALQASIASAQKTNMPWMPYRVTDGTYRSKARPDLKTPDVPGPEGGSTLYSFPGPVFSFISKMYNVLAKELPGKFSADELLTLAEKWMKKGKFNREEWEDTVRLTPLRAFLQSYADRGMKVPKKDLIEWLDVNRIQAETRILSRNTSEMFRIQNARDYYMEQLEKHPRGSEEWNKIDARISELKAEFDELNKNYPKYEDNRNVSMEGDNYVEIILSEPHSKLVDVDRGHFAEDVKGRQQIGWIRGQEFVAEDGRVYFNIDEMQSNRHQGGRKTGYRDDAKREEVRRKIAEEYGYFVDDDTSTNRLREAGVPDDLVDAWWKTHIKGDTPDAAFRKSWPTLLMKRALQWALEQGYDGITWTEGMQQATRNRQLFKVDKLELIKRDKRKKIWLGEGEAPTGIEYVLKSVGKQGRFGEWTDPYNYMPDTIVTPENLPYYVGKEVAAELLDKGVVERRGLEVGGPGNRKFYGQLEDIKSPKLIEYERITRKIDKYNTLMKLDKDLMSQFEPWSVELKILNNNISQYEKAIHKLNTELEKLGPVDKASETSTVWSPGIISRSLRDALSEYKPKEGVIRRFPEAELDKNRLSAQPGITFTEEMKQKVPAKGFTLYNFPGPVGRVASELWNSFREAAVDWWDPSKQPNVKGNAYLDGLNVAKNQFTRRMFWEQKMLDTLEDLKNLPEYDRGMFMARYINSMPAGYKMPPAVAAAYDNVQNILKVIAANFIKYGKMSTVVNSYLPLVVLKDPQGRPIADTMHFKRRRFRDPFKALNKLKDEGYTVEMDPAVFIPQYMSWAGERISLLEAVDNFKKIKAPDGLPAVRPSSLLPQDQASRQEFIKANFMHKIKAANPKTTQFGDPMINAAMKKLFTENIHVHKDIFQHIDNIFTGPYTGFARQFARLQSGTKQLIMYNMLFHPPNLMSSVMPSIGFMNTMKWLSGTHPALEFLKDPVARREGMYEMINAGVRLEGIFNKLREMHGDRFASRLNYKPAELKDLWRNPMKIATHPLRSLQDINTSFVFDGAVKSAQIAHYFIKKQMYKDGIVDPVKGFRRMPKLDEMAARKMAALDTNNTAGSIPPYHFTKAQRVFMKFLTFARDWNVGNALQAMSTSEWLSTRRWVPKFLRTEGLVKNEWLNYKAANRLSVLRAVVGAYVSAQVIQGMLQAANGKPITPTWKNEVGREFDIDTGLTGADGRPIYLRNWMYRQIDEAYGIVKHGAPDFISRKIEPLVGLTGRMAFNVSARPGQDHIFGKAAGYEGLLDPESLASMAKEIIAIFPFDDFGESDDHVKHIIEYVAPLLGTSVRRGYVRDRDQSKIIQAIFDYSGKHERLSRQAFHEVSKMFQRGDTIEQALDKTVAYMENGYITPGQFSALAGQKEIPVILRYISGRRGEDFLRSIPEKRRQEILDMIRRLPKD